MRKTGFLTTLLLMTAAGLMTASGAMAQADPPSRVARLNYLNGPVSFRPGSVEDWAAATLNYPLTAGDHLWTDAGAQAELHVGSTAVRMDSQTALGIVNLDDRVVQLSLTAGSLNVRVRSLRPDEVFEVDTPNAAVALRPGDYRFNVDGDRGLTAVTPFEGQADITGGGASFPVYARQTAHLSGTDTLAQEIAPAAPPDTFDAWCRERERREASVVSARYVPRDMIGYEDLDTYGVWRNVAPYGWVWIPSSVPGGWAPYQYGHWAWVEPWGWTWIDDAPWGFAPFHYGRWAFAGGMWVWAPGRLDVAVRPVYAPALVAFVGGPRFGVALAVGGGGGMAAWFALGPGEVYRPAYRVSDVYVRNINVVHVTDVTVINRVNVTNVRYVNQGVPGGVMAVPHDAFVNARPVHEAEVRVDAREMATAPVMGSTAAFAPRRESVLAGPVRTNVPPARFAERQVVSKSAPPPPPVSFAAKQRALETNGGRPLDANTMNSLRTNTAPRPAAVRNNAPPVRNDRPGGMNSAPPMHKDTPAVRTEETPRTPGAVNAGPPARKDTPVMNSAPPEHKDTPASRAVEDRKPEPKNQKTPQKKATKK
jgi:hypothetical protein